MSYENAAKNWEGFAQTDMLWSILTDPTKKNGRWTIEEFFAAGQMEVDIIWNFLKENNLQPQNTHSALDFGCGVGRISRALTTYFDQVTGVDISGTMIENAERLNEDLKNRLRFQLNKKSDLSVFPDNIFDFILTVIVLQHIPVEQSEVFIAEFLKKLKAGGVLVFQIPTKDIRKLSFWQQLKSKVRIRERLAMLGIGEGYHMQMNVIPTTKIEQIITQNKGKILKTTFTNQTDPSYGGNVKFIDKKYCFDYESQLFVVKKMA